MRIVVVGSGLIGVTSAYELARDGHEVTVLDRQPTPGRETSFANGSLVTPSMADPWNSPGSWKVLLGSLVRNDAPLQLRYRALPRLIDWGAAFLWNSRPPAYRRNTLSNLKLALYSADRLRALRCRTGVAYGQTNVGTLKLFRDRQAFDEAVRAAAALHEHGLNFQPLSAAETVALEPGLMPIQDRIAGAIHFRDDETGNAYKFVLAMAELASREGVQFHFGKVVSGLEAPGGRMQAVLCGSERFSAESVVVAAGSYTAPLLKSLALRVPVRPAKGYSISLPETAPRISIPVVDEALHAVVVPLEGGLRVAGTAEFAGFDLSLPQTRIQNLVRLAAAILPETAIDPGAVQAWCGLRPMSADGVPIIGPTCLDGLFINTGHGHLGWTMCMGSARLLADRIAGRPPAIDPSPYAFARPAGSA